jgi:hypothetical protein
MMKGFNCSVIKVSNTVISPRKNVPDCGESGAGGFPFSALCCIPLYPPPAYTKFLSLSKGCHVITATDIRVNRMARRLEGNVGQYAGGESVGDVEGLEPWDNGSTDSNRALTSSIHHLHASPFMTTGCHYCLSLPTSHHTPSHLFLVSLYSFLQWRKL